LPCAMSYSVVRTWLRTRDAEMKEGGKYRGLLYTERLLSVCGAGVCGVYLAPLYLASDVCALERTWRLRDADGRSPRYHLSVLSIIADLKY
jgi:hypothetical protein